MENNKLIDSNIQLIYNKMAITLRVKGGITMISIMMCLIVFTIIDLLLIFPAFKKKYEKKKAERINNIFTTIVSVLIVLVNLAPILF